MCSRSLFIVVALTTEFVATFYSCTQSLFVDMGDSLMVRGGDFRNCQQMPIIKSISAGYIYVCVCVTLGANINYSLSSCSNQTACTREPKRGGK